MGASFHVNLKFTYFDIKFKSWLLRLKYNDDTMERKLFFFNMCNHSYVKVFCLFNII